MRKYTVLRNLAAPVTGDPFGMPGGIRVEGAASAAPEPRVEVDDLEPEDLRELVRDPEVAAIAPVMPTTLIRPFEATEALAENAWGIAAVRADISDFDGTDVTVSVLDTGIHAGHEAFAGVTIIEQDFSGDGNGDVQGHGTHCAGTIFGRDVGGMRIGVARGVSRALIGKVLNDQGSGDSDMIFRGITWAIQEGADVVSMSLGFDFPGLVQQLTDGGWPADLATSAALEAYRGNLRMFDALMAMVQAKIAFDGGAVLVAAAGNESRRNIHPNYEIAASLPAAAAGVVSVGALGEAQGGLTVAPFSNTLPQVSAPGVGIISARTGGGLVAFNGTSMACPHVAGVAALWWQKLRSTPVPASATAVVAKLLATARHEVFAEGVDSGDRGMGLATAP